MATEEGPGSRATTSRQGDGDVKILGAEESPLRVGESLLLREPRSGRDRNLWRLILCESLRSATRDRQSTATDKDRKLRESKIELVSSFAIALSRIRIIPAYSEDDDDDDPITTTTTTSAGNMIGQQQHDDDDDTIDENNNVEDEFITSHT